MPILKIAPTDGINRRFPEHKSVGKKTEYCRELRNMLNLSSEFYEFHGATRLDSNAKPGACRWTKRIYYEDGGDRKRFQFAVFGGYMYKLDESTGTFNQVTISGSYTTTIEPDTILVDAQMKVSATVSTYLVDGKYFYKFNGNAAGDWERLPIKQDVDGNDIEPIYIAEYLDRLWVLTKNRNVVLVSYNLNPENLSDSTDAALIEAPPGKGGFPTALVKSGGVIFVIHEDYFSPISGSSVATFGIAPNDVVEGFGTRAPLSVIRLKTEFGFLNSSDNEYYVTSGTIGTTQDIPLSYPIKLRSLINPVKAHKTVAAYDPNLDAIRISYVLSGETLLNAEEIYSLTEKKWCGETRDRYISYYSVWDGNGDQGEMITGRSDVGAAMKEDDSLNFDGSAIHYKFVSASYVPEEDKDVTFEYFEPDLASLGNFNANFSYYLDTRLTTNGEEAVNMQGEVINLGLIEIADQMAFTNRFTPFIDKRTGRTIRFQIEGNTTNSKFKFYGIYAKYNKINAKYSKYISGR